MSAIAGIESTGQWLVGIAAVMPAKAVVPVVLVPTETIYLPGVINKILPANIRTVNRAIF